MEEDKLEAKFEEKKDLIDDSLDFCADIYNYYETDELFKLDFVSFIKKRNNLDENVKVKTETVVIKQVDEESGVRLYAKNDSCQDYKYLYCTGNNSQRYIHDAYP